MPDAYPTAPPDGAEFGLADLAATGRLARAVAMQARPGDVIGLWGGLGLGKTSFARAFIRAGGAESEEVPSPTFTLVQVYDLSDAAVWHFDLYRLARPEDAWELGIEDAFAEGISLIEWPDRLGPLLPPARLDIVLRPGATPSARIARLVGHGPWTARLPEIAAHV